MEPCYPHDLNGSCSHVTSPESRIWVVCKTINVCTNSSTTFAAAWTLSSETMAAATLDAASQTGVFNGVINDRFCLQHQDGRIRVRWHCGERTFAAYIRHRHIGPSYGMMVWVAIGYTYRSPLVRIDGFLNRARYISGLLRPVALPFVRFLRNPTFKQYNAGPHVEDIVRSFLDTENVRLLPCPARSPHVSPVENVWSMVAEILTYHHTPVPTADELWYRVETAWSSVLVHAIQYRFDSMPRHISAVITARGGCFWY
ncbi:transposable element Tc1 transposase [Trichonephila clavipes]|nr:transposable element Tc1 transposase [Trichonephila clavipes]